MKNKNVSEIDFYLLGTSLGASYPADRIDQNPRSPAYTSPPDHSYCLPLNHIPYYGPPTITINSMAKFYSTFCAILAVGLGQVLLPYQALHQDCAVLGQVLLLVQALLCHYLLHQGPVKPVQVPLPVQALLGLRHLIELVQDPLPVQALLGNPVEPF